MKLVEIQCRVFLAAAGSTALELPGHGFVLKFRGDVAEEPVDAFELSALVLDGAMADGAVAEFAFAVGFDADADVVGGLAPDELIGQGAIDAAIFGGDEKGERLGNKGVPCCAKHLAGGVVGLFNHTEGVGDEVGVGTEGEEAGVAVPLSSESVVGLEQPGILQFQFFLRDLKFFQGGGKIGDEEVDLVKRDSTGVLLVAQSLKVASDFVALLLDGLKISGLGMWREQGTAGSATWTSFDLPVCEL